MPDIRFTPEEIKQLIASGDLQEADILKMNPADAKVAIGEMLKADKMDVRQGVPPFPGAGMRGALKNAGAKQGPATVVEDLGNVPKAAPKAAGSNVERMGREEFSKVGYDVKPNGPDIPGGAKVTRVPPPRPNIERMGREEFSKVGYDPKPNGPGLPKGASVERVQPRPATANLERMNRTDFEDIGFEPRPKMGSTGRGGVQNDFRGRVSIRKPPLTLSKEDPDIFEQVMGTARKWADPRGTPLEYAETPENTLSVERIMRQLAQLLGTRK